MPILSGLVRRLRGDHLTALTAEVASMREVVLGINHTVTQIHEVLEGLNHDVRAGADATLPIFLGHAERLRLDADTAVGATHVIERQLALLTDQLAAIERSAPAED